MPTRYPEPTVSEILANYDVSLKRGFLPDPDPLCRLPAQWAAWDELARAIPELLQNGMLRNEVDRMPLIEDIPETISELRLAAVDLGFLANAYVHASWETEPSHHMPAALAIPGHRIIRALGFPHPFVLNYAMYVLWNWQRLDPQFPIDLENLTPVRNFLGGKGERWFICVHVVIEMYAADAIHYLYIARDAGRQEYWERAAEYLALVAASLENLFATLTRMREHTEAHEFFTVVRPWIHGYTQVKYEGVREYGDEPQDAVGESGSQSSVIPSVDAELGISHPPSEFTIYLDRMEEYMPPRHCALIRSLREGPSLLALAEQSRHTPFIRAVERCIGSVEDFRAHHCGLTRTHIRDQTPTSPHNSNIVGTAKTPALSYLEAHLRDTIAARARAANLVQEFQKIV